MYHVRPGTLIVFVCLGLFIEYAKKTIASSLGLWITFSCLFSVGSERFLILL